ncbi:unnamed protein product [Adineta steineri]|uniref:Uncharacterized protein n=1 Tax=Adineta steineri TaxID=433720 RepID=A0A819GYC4_9BILA|nr:unnamed protein product [Adineta steineri]CAF3889212.1 unnamed protein product [Adineta steineri]
MYFFIIFISGIVQCYGLFQSNWSQAFDNFTEIAANTTDEDIYKCLSYTGSHIDISHSINQGFSDYKDCQRSGLYTLNRIDRHFKVEIEVQRSWITEISAIIFNGTIKPICGLNSDQFSVRPTDGCEDNGVHIMITETNRFETVSVYHDQGNLTIISTHNKQGEPLHFNINIWQIQSDADSSYGLCTGTTCSSDLDRNLLINQQLSTYTDDIIALTCDIYIGNYLNSTGREPWERSLHYNKTIENVQKACISDIRQENSLHVAAGSLEVLFVEDQVNSKSITTIADIQTNFQSNLEDKLLKLAEIIDQSRIEVDDIIANMTATTTPPTIITTKITSLPTFEPTTTLTTNNYTSVQTSTPTTTSSSSSADYTTKKPQNNTLGIIIGCVVGGVALLAALVLGLYCYIKKSKAKQRRRIAESPNSFPMSKAEKL